MIVAIGLVYDLASSAALSHFYPQSNSWLLIPHGHVAIVLLFVVAVIVAPVVEETYFRGWIFTGLHQSWGPVAGSDDFSAALRTGAL